jgi:hypothetical protein
MSGNMSFAPVLANNFRFILLEPDGRRFFRRRLPFHEHEPRQAVKAERSEPQGSLDGLAAHVTS